MSLIPTLLGVLVFGAAGFAATPKPKKKSSTSSASPTKKPFVSPKPSTPKSSPSPKASPSPKPSATPTPSPTTPTPAPKREHAPNASLEPEELVEFAAQPERVQSLLTSALALTKQNLTYTYGSAEPSKGGMDCSGTIYYVLRSAGFKDVPRDSPGQYSWVRKAGQFNAVLSRSADSFEFKELQPGDLMFWSGTYQVERDIPVTHVMLYLGTEKKTKKRVMFGASDGRSYAGQQRWGVSVFDFVMPRKDPANPERSKSTFLGYGRIPGLRDGASTPAKEVAATSETTEPTETSKPTAETAPANIDEPATTATPKPSTPKPAARKSSSTPKPSAAQSSPKPKPKSKSSTPRPKKKSQNPLQKLLDGRL